MTLRSESRGRATSAYAPMVALAFAFACGDVTLEPLPHAAAPVVISDLLVQGESLDEFVGVVLAAYIIELDTEPAFGRVRDDGTVTFYFADLAADDTDELTLWLYAEEAGCPMFDAIVPVLTLDATTTPAVAAFDLWHADSLVELPCCEGECCDLGCDPESCDPGCCDPGCCDPGCCDPGCCDAGCCDLGCCDPGCCDPGCCDPGCCDGEPGCCDAC